jgi:membrane-bound lytic murein transglycosylase A
MQKNGKLFLGLLVCLLIMGLLVAYFFGKIKFPSLLHKATPIVKLEAVNYTSLPGWQGEDLDSALHAFQISCRWILKRDPNASMGNDIIPLKAEDWFAVCRNALSLNAASKEEVKHFFETAFVPMKWAGNDSGLFTGYYSPLYEGSLRKKGDYNVPIYGLPADLVTIQLQRFDPTLPSRKLTGRVTEHRMIPYYTRREINKGAIQHQAPVLAWLKSETDRLFLEIQGAGIIKLVDGAELPLGYAGENGKPYHSVAQVLINRGVMTKDSASMQAIRRYFKAHPKEGQSAMNANPSFVFFDKLSKSYTPGTQGIPLTPGYSMVVDRKWVPLGVPLWLNTKRPDEKNVSQTVELRRLMIAQDTGGAIRGKVRGDIYWGHGKEAGKIAGGMKYPGTYWLLLPKTWVAAHIPLG